MLFREAIPPDIPQLKTVRVAVKENRLSDPALITDKDYLDYITARGKGWVCEINAVIVGFAFVDVQENNIWALFVHPDFEKQGIGKKLHDTMMNWYFGQTQHTVWLSTAPGTRAEQFYRLKGWKETGLTKSREVLFEYAFSNWKLNSY